MNALMISWFYETPPSEIRNGLRLVSLAQCCDSLNCLVHVHKHHAHRLSGMCSGCIVNMASSILLINLSPIETQKILVKRIAQNLCKHGSYRRFQNGIYFVCCLIILDTLLFVNSTAYVSF